MLRDFYAISVRQAQQPSEESLGLPASSCLVSAFLAAVPSLLSTVLALSALYVAVSVFYVVSEDIMPRTSTDALQTCRKLLVQHADGPSILSVHF